MSDVVRHVREVQVISYTVSAEEVKRAICAYLYDNHNGVFTAETDVQFCEDNSAIVSTEYERTEP